MTETDPLDILRMEEEYNTAPSDEVFNQIKAAAMIIWHGYDNEYGYVDEKIGMIRDLPNLRDNWGYIVGMFDHHNQEKLIGLLDGEAKDLVYRATEENRQAAKDLEAMGIKF